LDTNGVGALHPSETNGDTALHPPEVIGAAAGVSSSCMAGGRGRRVVTRRAYRGGVVGRGGRAVVLLWWLAGS
jgi:hypothetical protein